MNRLIKRRENGLIKVITGIKRCGKSYLLFKLYYRYLLDSGVEESRIIRIPLDDHDYGELHDSRHAWKKGGQYVSKYDLPHDGGKRH